MLGNARKNKRRAATRNKQLPSPGVARLGRAEDTPHTQNVLGNFQRAGALPTRQRVSDIYVGTEFPLYCKYGHV